MRLNDFLRKFSSSDDLFTGISFHCFRKLTFPPPFSFIANYPNFSSPSTCMVCVLPWCMAFVELILVVLCCCVPLYA
ncbi:unnamed protein product [Tuber aestivum]|uniref:Uncharacterized protein n=1 Tax=Tuber aestivum TaxID=59557 RepID=A0A292PLG8_9PEZI|nr:unnamed protein product [Tuber aestivum]